MAELVILVMVGGLFLCGILLNRFSLRTLLIVMTATALLLGITSALIRSLH